MKLEVERVRLDRGGYVSSGFGRGRYFGHGGPLYRVVGEGEVRGRQVFLHEFVRAPNARAARKKVAEQFGVVPSFPRKPKRQRAVLARMRSSVEHARKVGAHAIGSFSGSQSSAKAAAANREAMTAYLIAADALEEAGETRRSNVAHRMAAKFKEIAEFFEKYRYESKDRVSR